MNKCPFLYDGCMCSIPEGGEYCQELYGEGVCMKFWTPEVKLIKYIVEHTIISQFTDVIWRLIKLEEVMKEIGVWNES